MLCGSIQSFSQKIVETSYYVNHPDLGGDVVINSSTTEMDGDNNVVSFEVEASVAGEYYLSFWMCPSKLEDGTYAKYAVSVNGNILSDGLCPKIGDWQSVSLSHGGTVTLNKGVNIISVLGSGSDVPSVEHVKMSTVRQKSIINGDAYDQYKSYLEEESSANAMQNAIMATSLNTDTLSNELLALASTDAPLYNYTYALNLSINYTFYKTVSFTQGQQVFLATNGVDNFTHILEFFSAASPESYSWSAMSNSNCMASLNVTIPATGLYYVRVRSYLNARSGLCNLNINGENYYENIPVYSLGVRCLQGTDQVYNTFTCYSTGDPRLWIEEGSSIPGKISAYNDDYGKRADFAWGRNARIKKQFSRPVHAALLSTFSSYNPTAKCDLYIKCPNSTIMPYFDKLKDDDAIQSAPASGVYNCISWSGAITSYWEWPCSPYSSYYSTDPLTAFDNFYTSRGLTRNGATEANSVVDLWAYVGSDDSRDYSHASIRKGADSNAHGYDWESKPGSLMRTFHPRYALEGNDGYGQVVEYYTNSNTSTTVLTLDEEIADGISEIEYVDFTAEENTYINQRINTLNSSLLSQFNNLYNNWNNVFTNTIYSNPVKIADCNEYRAVLNLCSANKGLQYAVFKHLGDGDIAAIKLVEDLTLSANQPVLQAVRAYNAANKTRAGVNVIRPVLSNTIDYVKRLLSIENASLVKSTRSATTGISYSNYKEFDVTSTLDNVHVTFSLSNPSKVSLSMVDLSGNIVCAALTDDSLESGDYSYNLTSSKGNVYLVKLVIDGHVSVKKIILNK